ncbi:hypothetical protein QWY87_17020 [Lutimonas halocynthiae]|uniref:hypothetical protein n=1 Tax=Lutimonas halocynthiae TaxID=1446477 RepID=UPI0025B53090|nr:hypothetical protein [Lutimonas halocynthiae]MDN3644419.1 hypothetical protein [Lutimonas halocynthiae]
MRVRIFEIWFISCEVIGGEVIGSEVMSFLLSVMQSIDSNQQSPIFNLKSDYLPSVADPDLGNDAKAKSDDKSKFNIPCLIFEIPIFNLQSQISNLQSSISNLKLGLPPCGR